jgi:hypothetical protein
MDPQPPTQPVTTRIGGSSSARIAVVALVVILGGVAWVGFSGRGPAQPLTPATQPPVANATASPESSAQASPAQTPRPSSRASRPILTPPPEPVLGAITFGQDAFGVIAFVDGRMYVDVLQEIAPGRFRGSFRVPLPSKPGGHRLVMSQLWTRDRSRDSYVELGQWPLRLDFLTEGSEVGGDVLQEEVGAQPNKRGVPRAVRRGFTVSGRVQGYGSFGVVSVEMDFLPRR